MLELVEKETNRSLNCFGLSCCKPDWHVLGNAQTHVELDSFGQRAVSPHTGRCPGVTWVFWIGEKVNGVLVEKHGDYGAEFNKGEFVTETFAGAFRKGDESAGGRGKTCRATQTSFIVGR